MAEQKPGGVASFNVGFGKGAGPGEDVGPEGDGGAAQTFRIAVVSHLVAGAEWSLGPTPPPDAVPVDVESFDAVMGAFAPSLAVDVDDPFDPRAPKLRVDLRFGDRKALRPNENRAAGAGPPGARRRPAGGARGGLAPGPDRRGARPARAHPPAAGVGRRGLAGGRRDPHGRRRGAADAARAGRRPCACRRRLALRPGRFRVVGGGAGALQDGARARPDPCPFALHPPRRGGGPRGQRRGRRRPGPGAAARRRAARARLPRAALVESCTTPRCAASSGPGVACACSSSTAIAGRASRSTWSALPPTTSRRR